MSGVFVLVVGPSGAGKDSLIRGARAALRNDPYYVFVRRTITRPAEDAFEDHEAVSTADFTAHRGQGAFCLWWEAHGLSYGIPAAAELHVRDGGCAVANVSRAIISHARSKFPAIQVINVTASVDVLAARLARRRRETEADIKARLMRAGSVIPDGRDVVTIVNEGSLDAGVARMVVLLRSLRSPVEV